MFEIDGRLVHSVEKNLSEHGEKLDEETKKEVQKAIDEAKAVSSDADVETLKDKSSALSTASMKIGQAMYSKGSGGSSSGGEGGEGEQKAKEAEYEEKKDDENKQQKH